MFVFDREPIDELTQDKKQAFIRGLNFYLKHDHFTSYLIKCSCKTKVEAQHIASCRKWLKKEIEKVDPYLVVMMGKLSVAAIFGGKYLKLMREKVFYTRVDSSGAKRQYYFGCNIASTEDRIKDNLIYLERFIKGFYNG